MNVTPGQKARNTAAVSPAGRYDTVPVVHSIDARENLEDWMSDIFTPAELRAKFADLPYITPYERIVALVDEEARLVELHEFHARGRCTGGAAWEVYHYARTSPLILDARREGARNILTCAEGRE